MIDQTNGFESSSERDNKLSTMQFQLRSQRASDILRGMTQARQWLQENLEDRQVYELLLDSVQENHDIREKVRDLFLEMVQKGSKSAEEAISVLPSTPKDILADADDAYYAAEYGRAVQLYLQVLKRVPDHERAKEYLTKAKSAQQGTGDLVLGLPRDAVQYYRRARSYLAAKDFMLAIQSLSAAVETAQARGMYYPDADELLKTAQDSLIADEYKQKANHALEKEQWGDASEYIDKGLALQLADVSIKKELDNLRTLLRAELELRNLGVLRLFVPLGHIRNAQKMAASVVNPDNPLLSLITQQLKLIKMVQVSFIILITCALVFAFSSKMNEYLGFDNPTVTSTLFVAPTETMIPSTVTATLRVLPSLTATETLMPTPSAIPVLGYGKLTEYTYPFEKPGGNPLSLLLSPKQFVTIMDRQEIKGFVWYKCKWVISNNAIEGEGWLLEKYIQFAPAPSPVP